MPKTHPVPLTREEMDKLIQASMDNEFYYMFFMVAKTTGRRLGEYYDVKVKDVKEENGMKVMTTKVLKRRMKIEKDAILTEEVYRLIQQYIVMNKLQLDDYLFRKRSYRHHQNRVAFYAKKAGIGHVVSMHSFRHFFVTELLKLGWHYDKIAKLTGHQTPQTLVNYDHVQSKDIHADAIEALKNF